VKLSPLFFRRVHKWIGLILGLQFVIWTISGAVMAVLDMDTVSGGPRPPGVEAKAPPQPGNAWPTVQRVLGSEPITHVAMRPMLDRHVYEVGTDNGTRLFDAESGHLVSVDAVVARRVAEAAYVGSGKIKATELITKRTFAIREHALPAWRIDFADDDNSSFYVSQATGKLLERRNDTWRLWDFVWMLHNMDYVDRKSFNHPLIILVGFGVFWLAITGFYLLLNTKWRPDLRRLTRLRTPADLDPN
jgi:hypothetical protein